MYSENNLSQCHFAHHTCHKYCPWREPGQNPPELWYSIVSQAHRSVKPRQVPLCKRPFSIRRASTSSFGSRRQNDVTRCKNGAVGPPCCHSDRSTPERPNTILLAGSAAQVLRCRPSLNPSLARLPILNKAAARKKGISSTATPFSARYAWSSTCGGRVDPGQVRAA